MRATREKTSASHADLERQRWELLRHVDALLTGPMVVLAFIWLGLLVLDLTVGLNRFLTTLTYIIWALFVLDFLLELLIAPHKGTYLRTHWLTAISLVLPTFRVFALLRVIRILSASEAVRSLGLLRVVTSLNRGMGALALTFGRRGIGFVLALTAIVIFVGSAGMAYFERPAASGGAGLAGYWDALWWTAMVMTTMGSEYWPKSLEGRILAFLLAVYAFAVFGYITATIASHFVRVDMEDAATRQANSAAPAELETARELAALRAEVAALRQEIVAPMPAPDSRAQERRAAPMSRREPREE